MDRQQDDQAGRTVLPRSVLALPPAVRLWTGVVTAVLCALVLWRFGWSPATPAFLALPVFAVVLGVVDLRTRLLPNALLLPFGVCALALFSVASLVSGEWDRLVGAIVGGLAMFALYLVLALVSPGGLGMGDVKLAGVLGLYGGYAGVNAWAVTVLGGFILGALIGVFLLLAQKASRRSVFPFGPPMIVACLAGVMVFA
ncbi:MULTISPECIES: prepilin peptidase [unclassified Arthrobacter]|uniref:prepilin peptidase n=1 Tax=unclassified Arthrobacter TaxID=235627 RepID=UPI001492313A|nr:MULTISPECIES: A24 family peptidase [unclassified Arthrobacter]NOJ62714.1 prepilin peptidase [Arthrobacter sp. 147(2020)]